MKAFAPEQLAALYDVNVIGAHRVNRAAQFYDRIGFADLLHPSR